MRSIQCTSLALAVLLAGSLLSAQPTPPDLRLFGEVSLDSKTSKFFVSCTEIGLRSTKVNLGKLGVGVFEMTAKNRGTPAKPDIEVLTAKPSRSAFKIAGTGEIGHKLGFEVKDSSGALFMFCWFAVRSTFLPMEPYTKAFSGTWYLDVNPVFFVGTTVLINGAGKVDLNIPALTALIGLPIHGQAGLLYPNLPLVFINSDCMTLIKHGI